MADETKTTTTPPTTKKPTRADLDAAKARFKELRLAAEHDQAKIVRSRDLRAGMELQARRLGVPFDPELCPPLYGGDPAVHEALHRQHYVIADLEAALAQGSKSKS